MVTRLWRLLGLHCVHACAPDDRGDGVLAETEVTRDPALAAALDDKRQHLGGKPIGLRAVAGLPPERLAPRRRPRSGEAGPNPLAKHVAPELRDAGEHRRHHSAVWRIDLEGHATHRDDRYPPARQPVERIKQVLRRVSPAA